VKPLNSTENLKTSGLKATLPRLRVLELFEKSTVRHLSAEDVYKLLQKDGTDTGLATVYRVLTQFEQAGLLIRHHFESEKAVFELNQGSHHDHLVCVQCGHVEEFYDAEIEKRQSDVAAERGFRIHDHSLHIYADCLRASCPRRTVKSQA
jgi:Fur family ferric uptake transcriptional regulator